MCPCVHVCSDGLKHLLYLLLGVWYPSYGAIVLDTDQEVTAVGVSEGDNGLGYVSTYSIEFTWTSRAGWPLVRTLELAKMALAELYGIADALCEKQEIGHRRPSSFRRRVVPRAKTPLGQLTPGSPGAHDHTE